MKNIIILLLYLFSCQYLFSQSFNISVQGNYTKSVSIQLDRFTRIQPLDPLISYRIGIGMQAQKGIFRKKFLFNGDVFYSQIGGIIIGGTNAGKKDLYHSLLVKGSIGTHLITKLAMHIGLGYGYLLNSNGNEDFLNRNQIFISILPSYEVNDRLTIYVEYSPFLSNYFELPNGALKWRNYGIGIKWKI